MKTTSLFPDFSSTLSGEQMAAKTREWLSSRREEIKDAFLQTGDADAYVASYAKIIDGLLAALFGLVPKASQKGFALLAVGGYGRSELYPFSDIDLLFLYEKGHDEEAAKTSEFMLYRLWDIGLKIGQAHRSVEEALTLAEQDITVRTNMLDARFLVGDGALFARFMQRFQREIMANTELSFVEAKLAERDGRHHKFGDSRYMLEPNVKEGKGGLRDVHTLWWLARYTHPVASLSDFAKKRLLSAEEYSTFDEARRFLARTRIHLHLVAGGPDDRLTFDRQQALAPLMGYGHPSPNQAISRFMRRYFVAVRTIGSITRIFCALLEEEKKRKPKQPLGWLKPSSWALGSFKLEGERLHIKSEQAFDKDPLLILELFKVAQENELDIHPHALQLITRRLPLIDDKLRANPRANEIFMEILLSPKGPEATLKRMSDSGVLGKFIPDFGRIIGQTQFNMYHVYTVDEHTLVALGYLHSIETGALKKTVPLASELMPRITMRKVLFLALLCHDIAKGRGGDHSELGEVIAKKLAARFGFTQEEADTTAWLVRNHLLLSMTASKRDINDPKTISDFVAEVCTPERLKLLLVLTVADMCAVRPGVWNAWKGALMRELFRRSLQAMGAGYDDVAPQDTKQIRDYIESHLPDWQEHDIEHYMELGNPTFWVSLSGEQHMTIARMLNQADSMAWPLLIDTQHNYEHSMTEVIVCAFDAHGLFSNLAGALSLAGANIISAKIFTLKNGMAVDIFQLQDAAGEVFDRPDKLAKMSVYIEQVLSGELKLAEAFHKRPRAGARSIHTPGLGQVFVDNDASSLYTVIEVTGQDRSGFLHSVTQALADLGVSIVTAHISTYGTQVADVFYVKDGFGMKISHEAKLRQIQEKLSEAIGK